MPILRGLEIAALVCGTLVAQHHDAPQSGHVDTPSHGAHSSGTHSSPPFSHGFPAGTVPYAYPVIDPGYAPPASQTYTDSYQPPPAPANAGDSFRPPYSTAAEPPPHGLIIDFENLDATATPEPPHYYIALKDHHIYLAVAYWVQGDTLHYFLPGNTHNQVSISLVDRGLTERLNRESGTAVQLPAAK
jgi:hypothetical protein